MIVIKAKDPGGWWCGYKLGTPDVVGLFPGSHVEEQVPHPTIWPGVLSAVELLADAGCANIAAYDAIRLLGSLFEDRNSKTIIEGHRTRAVPAVLLFPATEVEETLLETSPGHENDSVVKYVINTKMLGVASQALCSLCATPMSEQCVNGATRLALEFIFTSNDSNAELRENGIAALGAMASSRSNSAPMIAALPGHVIDHLLLLMLTPATKLAKAVPTAERVGVIGVTPQAVSSMAQVLTAVVTTRIKIVRRSNDNLPADLGTTLEGLAQCLSEGVFHRVPLAFETVVKGLTAVLRTPGIPPQIIVNICKAASSIVRDGHKDVDVIIESEMVLSLVSFAFPSPDTLWYASLTAMAGVCQALLHCNREQLVILWDRQNCAELFVSYLTSGLETLDVELQLLVLRALVKAFAIADAAFTKRLVKDQDIISIVLDHFVVPAMETGGTDSATLTNGIIVLAELLPNLTSKATRSDRARVVALLTELTQRSNIGVSLFAKFMALGVSEMQVIDVAEAEGNLVLELTQQVRHHDPKVQRWACEAAKKVMLTGKHSESLLKGGLAEAMLSVQVALDDISVNSPAGAPVLPGQASDSETTEPGHKGNVLPLHEPVHVTKHQDVLSRPSTVARVLNLHFTPVGNTGDVTCVNLDMPASVVPHMKVVGDWSPRHDSGDDGSMFQEAERTLHGLNSVYYGSRCAGPTDQRREEEGWRGEHNGGHNASGPTDRHREVPSVLRRIEAQLGSVLLAQAGIADPPHTVLSQKVIVRATDPTQDYTTCSHLPLTNAFVFVARSHPKTLNL